MKKYAIRYTWNTELREGGYSKKDVESEHHGLCDAMVIISVVRQEDGSYSQMVLSADGQTKKQFTQDDLFKAWLLFGMQLADEGGVDGWKKQLLDSMAVAVRHHFGKIEKGIHDNSKVE